MISRQGSQKSGASIAAFASALWLLPVVSAPAAFMVYSDRDAWLATVNGTPQLESFNSFSSTVNFGGGSIAAGPLTLSSNTSPAFEAAVTIPADFLAAAGMQGIDGTPLIVSGGLDTGEQVTVGLPAEFSAFGFEFENFDFSGDALSIIINGQTVGSIPGTDDTIGFIGIGSDDQTFNSVEFLSAANLGTFNAIDNIEWGTTKPIPEPSASFLVALGILAVVRRKR